MLASDKQHVANYLLHDYTLALQLNKTNICCFAIRLWKMTNIMQISYCIRIYSHCSIVVFCLL